MQRNDINKYIQMYIQESGEDIGLLSLPYPQIKSLSNLSTTNDTTVRCKANASFFEREGSKAIIGRNIGVRPNFDKVNEAPDQRPGKSLYDITVFNDNSYVIDTASSWDHRDNVKLSYSVPLALINKGVDVNLYSTEIVTSNRINQLDTYTYFFKLKDGRFGLIGTTQYRPNNLRDFLRKSGYDFEFLVQNDGGSSAQINHNGKVVFNKEGVENQIPNCLIFYEWNNLENDEPKDAKEYAVFPMPVVNITQDVGGKLSHYPDIKALDLAAKDRYARAYAPFTMKVLGVKVNNKAANEVIYGSCDELGNMAKVRCADGVDRVLTAVFLHDDSIDEWTPGKVIKAGEYCYNQGIAGYSTGPHIHFELAEGWQTIRKARNGSISFEIKNAINPYLGLHTLEGWNTIQDSKGHKFKSVNARLIDDHSEEFKQINDELKKIDEEMKRLSKQKSELEKRLEEIK